MLERRTPWTAIAAGTLIALLAAGCGASERDEVSTSAQSAVTEPSAEDEAERNTPDAPPPATPEAGSSSTIPFIEPAAPSDPAEPLSYNVLTSPREFDATLGSLTPKQPDDPALASLCVAYYELFAGYRLLDQFSDSDEAGLARGLAMRRIRSAITESDRMSGSQIKEAARSRDDLQDDSDALAALQEGLSSSARAAEEELGKNGASSDAAAARAAAAAVLDLPADQRSALDELGDSDIGCVERRPAQ